MADPIKRDGEAVKKDVLSVIEFYQKGFKDKLIGDPYFDGYRSALDTIHEQISNTVQTEIK